MLCSEPDEYRRVRAKPNRAKLAQGDQREQVAAMRRTACDQTDFHAPRREPWTGPHIAGCYARMALSSVVVAVDRCHRNSIWSLLRIFCVSVELARDGDAIVLTLNRPEALNALSFSILEAISSAIDEVAAGCRSGDHPLAAIVMPATLEHVRDISLAGERMPPKSTYFYPKLLSGLVFNPLE